LIIFSYTDTILSIYYIYIILCIREQYYFQMSVFFCLNKISIKQQQQRQKEQKSEACVHIMQNIYIYEHSLFYDFKVPFACFRSQISVIYTNIHE
jgi:hypothetical protein